MEGLTRSAAFGRLEAARALRSRGTLLCLVLFTGTHAVGRLRGPGEGDGLFVVGFFLGYLLTFSPGLSADRALSFDRLMVLNLLAPGEYAVGKVVAMLAWTASLAAWCWLTAVALPMGDIRFASWYASLVLLLAVAVLPFVVLTDLLLGVRLPAAAALIITLVGLIIAMALGAEAPRILEGAGLLVTPYSYESLVPLTIRAAAGIAATPIIVAVSARRRGYRS